jgi:hypothetical protein
MYHPDSAFARWSNRLLPRLAHSRQKPTSRKSGFVDELVAPFSIETDRRCCHENLRRGLELPERLAEVPGPNDTALSNEGLAGLGPPSARDTLAGEVHNRVDSVERTR